MRESPSPTCYPEIKSGRKTLGKARRTTARLSYFMKNPEKQSEARRIADARREGVDTALSAYREIVDALVKQAKGGSCPHAKLVFELLERKMAKAAVEDDEEEEGPSLADIVLERLQLVAPPKRPDTTETTRG
jgi:hypothetical protein